MELLLVINSGSTSLKFGVYNNQSLKLLYSGMVENMANKATFEVHRPGEKTLLGKEWSGKINHEEALSFVLDWLKAAEPSSKVVAAGHRVVLGGEKCSAPTLITNEILDYLESLSIFVPSHQPFNVGGIRAMEKVFPGLPQVAVFDSSFHLTMSNLAKTYALPKDIRDMGVRHWGFHGISYDFVNRQIKQLDPTAKKVLVGHLGGGASMCAIKDGKSFETSMAFSGLTGLPMATRSGDIPIDVAFYLLKEKGFDVAALEKTLYKNSGLLGLSGISDDMRKLSSSEDPSALFAIDYFVYALTKFAGSYIALMEGLDSLVFTAGIGEHSALVRQKLCANLAWLGVELNQQANQENELLVSSKESRVKVWVIPTNEELMIAEYTSELTR